EDRQGVFYIAPKVRSSAAEFNAAAASIGHINVLRDKDQIVRRIPAFIQYGKRKYPQISLEIARLYNKRDDISFSYPRTLRFSAKNIPINRDGSIYIRMLSQKEITKYFIPFEDVLAGKYKKDRFKNKVIIIGQTIVGAKNADLIPTPAGTQFGVLLQASCIHNVITGEHIYRMGENSIIVLLFIWAVLMGSTIFTSLTALNTFLLLFFGGAIAYFSLYSMRNSGLFFDAVPFFVLSFSCYFSSVIYSLFTAVKKLLQKESAINVLKDVEKEITNILSPAEFSDDAGEETFTSFEGEALIKQTPEITLKTILSSVGIQYGALIIGSASRKYQVIAEEGDLTSKAEVEKIINKSLEQKKPVIMNKIPLSSGLKKYDIKNMMLIPVIFHPTIKVFGIFFNKQYAPFSKHAHFSKDDLPIISSLTLQSLIAIQNAKLNITLKDTQLESIFRLSVAIEYRDRETGMHIHRVSEYAGIIGENIGFRENEIELIKNAMPLHDIGKIAIPDKVLLKPGRLTDEEREIVKEHPVLGAKILEGSKSITLKVSEIIALYHHEKYDGTGYPFGLKGNSIPLYGRIAAIADIFDALSSKRVYKEAMGFEESKSLLLQESGTTFDPRLVKSFLKSEEKIKMIMETYREKEDGTSMGAKHE
ncbi:MAG TPA: CHASE2 domain-containing protein, partial [bacterium]|nr:CHASE2 domain-containing protein [bacterium]